MNTANEIIEHTVQLEGGYTNNPHDSGGETNWGVTENVARAFGYVGAMKDMTRENAKVIYRKRFWDACNLDLIAAQSEPIALELFDTGVNMGPAVAGQFLQRALNVLNLRGTRHPDVGVDGRIGPMTARALQAFLKLRGKAGEEVLLKALNCMQGTRYIELAEKREKDEEFVYGWLANRITL